MVRKIVWSGNPSTLNRRWNVQMKAGITTLLVCLLLGVGARAVFASDGKPQISGGRVGEQSWLTAEYKGLKVTKMGHRTEHKVGIEFRHGQDVLYIEARADQAIDVVRGTQHWTIGSGEQLLAAQQALSNSEALFAAKQLLAEQLFVSNLDAPEMSLLSAAAFAASLAGDTDAPRRLTDRFVEKHFGIVRQVRQIGKCWDGYSKEVDAAWNDMQACMNEADQDPSLLNAAYRRVACNGVWMWRSESAWFEYLDCIALGKVPAGKAGD